MTKIKPLAPKKCPDCEADGSLFIDQDRLLTCRLCGYKARDMSAEKSQATEEDPRKSLRITYGKPNTKVKVDRWAETKYSSGLGYAKQGKFEEALRAFEEAIDLERGFVDAHLWVARLTLDLKEKHQHYSEVLAYMPQNLEAQRELMVLKGDMTRAEADRAMDMSSERDIQSADFAVGTELVEIVCSNCGGTLEVPSDTHEVTCQFCGNLEAVNRSSGYGLRSLSLAMIKDKGQGTAWRVGEHLLHCDNCGAERVITSSKMTTQCPFCSSNHVIKADALQSFRQPDGILPFSIKPKMAREALDKALNSFSEKFKGIFFNNRPDKITMTPVYLPFWMFDVSAQIIRTKVDKTSKRSLVEINASRSREEYSDGLNNVPYCGVTSPSHRLTDRLEKYGLEAVKPYDPKLLAGFTAELYSIDYQQASLNVRGELGERFRFRHGHNPHGDYQTHVSYLIQGMSFRLLMLPVWVATIIEDDDDVRVGLIHGQTGQTLLGKAVRPE
ncbi:MAG: hypothetical protein Phog2KO_15840 [Phototrophicaceae bacterium]